MSDIETPTIDDLSNKNEENVFKEFTSAAEAVEDNYKLYTTYTIASKFPNCVDGLKSVHRRILWCIRNVDSFTKMPKLIGMSMDLHPYGDSSIEEAMKRLAQPFNNAIPYILGNGNFGAYHNDGDAAAARYLEACIGEFAQDVFFNNISEKSLTYIPAESGEGYEPEFFIPIIPTVFLTGAFGIAMCFKSDIHPMNISSVCDMVKAFVQLKKANPAYLQSHKEIAKYLLPDFPVDGLLRNPQELIKKYSEGDYAASLMVDGSMTLTPTTIHLHALPYGIAINAVYEKLGKEVVAKDGFVVKNFQQVKDNCGRNTKCNFVLTLRRGISPFAVLDQLKHIVGFSKAMKPLLLYVNRKGTKAELTPIQLLDIWYQERFRSILSGLKQLQNKLINDQRKLLALLIVNGHSKEVFDMFENSESEEDTIVPLCKRFGLTYFQAKFLADLKYKQITRRGKEDLLKEKAANELKIKELQQRFATIDDKIIEDAMFIKNKYGAKTPRKTKLPEFKGYVKIGNEGVIQYWNEEDRNQIIRNFGQENVTVVEYPTSGHFYRYIYDNMEICAEQELAFPREIACPNMVITTHKLKSTIGLRAGTIYRLDLLMHKVNNEVLFVPVGDQFTAIRKNGKVEVLSATDIPKRKQVISQGIMTDIIYVSPCTASPLVVVHANANEPNVLRIDKVMPGEKINKMPLGETIIVGVFNPTDSAILSIPDAASNRCNVKHVQIKNFSELLTDDKCFLIYLSRKTTSVKRRLAPCKKNSDLWTIV